VLTFLIFIQVWVISLFKKIQPSLKIKPNKITHTQIQKAIKHTINKPPPHLITSLILGTVLGTFIMTSAWDSLIYGVFLIILGFLLVISFPNTFFRLLGSAIAMGIIALLTALPWLMNFTSISEGIAFVTERSPIWQLFALWTNHVTFSVIAIILVIFASTKIKSIKGQSTLLVAAAMVFTAWTMLALPEVIYFKDIYSGHPRANTMFKLTYQGFILMSLIGGWVIGVLASGKFIPQVLRLIGLAVMSLLIFANLLFPYFSYRDYYGRLNDRHSLDGYSWLQEDHPSDYAAITWMQENIKGQPVILEAVGESYTTFDRVSAVTGLPTVLGWRVHEWLWRGGFDIPGQRTEEVRTMFEQPLSDEARNLYDQYEVEFIFIGDKEYEAYTNIKTAQLQSLGETVFSQGSTFVIHRTHSQI
jgi:uncharacterized membrane protein